MVCPIPRTGRLGFVGDYTGDTLERYSRVRNWTFDGVANPEVRTYSGTRFGTQRIPGFIEYTGSFQGYGGLPPLFPGDTFDFLGYTAPTSGVPCTEGCAYVVPAIVTSLQVVWNWTAENRSHNWTINFASNGDFEELPTFVDDCDDDVFCDDQVCQLTFEMFDCNDVAVEFCNIVSATLNFTSQIISYSNNSTNCQVFKDVGNLDWTLDIVDQNPCIVPTLQEDYWFRIMSVVDPAAYWILKYGMFTNVANFRIDTEAQEMISKSNIFSMQAVNCCDPGTPVRGSITMPDGRVAWPYATAS